MLRMDTALKAARIRAKWKMAGLNPTEIVVDNP